MPFIEKSNGISSLLRNLGLKPTGGSHRAMKNYIREYGIITNWDTSNRGWSKGKTIETDERIKGIAFKRRIPNNIVFSENAPSSFGGHKLLKRLLKIGWQYKCSICGISEWLGKPLSLDVDHINGISNDNRFENLRIICPNCHRQTETWGNKKANPLP